jgi:hypothetical protein
VAQTFTFKPKILRHEKNVYFAPSSFVHGLVDEVDKVNEVYQPYQPHKPYQPMHKTWRREVNIRWNPQQY